jgi:hypothetical protein
VAGESDTPSVVVALSVNRDRRDELEVTFTVDGEQIGDIAVLADSRAAAWWLGGLANSASICSPAGDPEACPNVIREWARKNVPRWNG